MNKKSSTGKTETAKSMRSPPVKTLNAKSVKSVKGGFMKVIDKTSPVLITTTKPTKYLVSLTRAGPFSPP